MLAPPGTYPHPGTTITSHTTAGTAATTIPPYAMRRHVRTVAEVRLLDRDPEADR
ncbi:hypothetical protein ACH5AO_20195 [Streptomyces sp. NPDC018964]|uniref:hypothetical protein n=1 Tax=unclassified Streptomyces TaxID=2593676 RepID=UPI00378B06B1